jgi:hypothetical protein
MNFLTVLGIIACVFIAMIVFAIVFVVIGNKASKNKKAITSDDFVKLAQEKGWDVTETSSDDLPDGLVGLKAHANGFCVYYFSNEIHIVQNLFMFIKKQMESGVNENGAMTKSTTFENYWHYSATSGEMYCVVSRVGNTMIYARTYAQDKNQVQEFLKEVKY